MPPTARKPAAKKEPEDVETTAEVDGARDGICVRCWPDGWPSEDTKSANCEHGTWQR